MYNTTDLALDLLKANDNPADAGSDNSADVVIFDKPADDGSDKPADAVIDPNKYNTSSLVTLAEKSYAFRSGNRLRFWKNWIYEYCKYNLFFVFTYLFLFIYLLKCHLILNACMFVQLNP